MSQTAASTLFQERATGRKGILLNDRSADIAIVQFDDLPEITWAEWKDLAI